MANRNSNQSYGNDRDWDQNRDRYNQQDDFNQGRESSGSYDDVNYRQSYQNRGSENIGYGDYGYRGSQDDLNRGRGNWESVRNSQSGYGQRGYTNDYNRDYNTRYGYDERNRNTGRDRNIYGGDTRNYGNANQGGYDRDWWDKTSDEVSSWFGDEDAERRRRMDKQRSGQNRGKGPKGYNRSDDRILEDICVRLSDDDHVDATDIEVKVENNEVILSGTVQDRQQKRRAEDIAERISGVKEVENKIKVRRENSDTYNANDWTRNRTV